MKAHQIMSNPLIWATTMDSIEQVARRLAEKKISGVPVKDAAGQPVGVLTRSDLAFYEAKCFGRVTEEPTGQALISLISKTDSPSGFDLRPQQEPIEGWLSPRIFSVDKNATIDAVAREMLRHDVRHVFVRARSSGELIGVITATDLLKYMVRSSHHPRRSSQQTRASLSKAFLTNKGGIK